MSEPIFVKVRNDKGEVYASYEVYWKLVGLVGYQTCELSEVDPQSNNTYIFAPDNGNVAETCRGEHTARYILWYLERVFENETILERPDLLIKDYFDEVWCSDRHMYETIKKDWNQREDTPKIKYVIVGGHKDLGGEPKEPKKWDFVTIAYLYGRRYTKVEELKAQGKTFAPSLWGDDTSETLAYSRMGFCYHQDEMPVIEPLRYIYFACWKLPMLWEYSVDVFPYTGIPEEDYRLMTEVYPFEKTVREALEAK